MPTLTLNDGNLVFFANFVISMCCLQAQCILVVNTAQSVQIFCGLMFGSSDTTFTCNGTASRCQKARRLKSKLHMQYIAVDIHSLLCWLVRRYAWPQTQIWDGHMTCNTAPFCYPSNAKESISIIQWARVILAEHYCAVHACLRHISVSTQISSSHRLSDHVFSHNQNARWKGSYYIQATTG